jgi:2-phospho-L-lactate guanylyltransferase
MTTWAIVPVKPLRQSKSRLGSVLGAEERLALSREMLNRVLEALAGVPEIERTLLVSRDSEAMALARQHGARTLSERSRLAHLSRPSRPREASWKDGGPPGLAARTGCPSGSRRGPPIDLNQALQQATRAAVGSGASAVLVVPADLPLVTADDLRQLVELAGTPPVVVLAPDRRQSGTNAMLASPAGLIEYSFGPSSFDRHRALGIAAGARVLVCDRPGLALDLDLPEDLGLFREISGGKAA